MNFRTSESLLDNTYSPDLSRVMVKTRFAPSPTGLLHMGGARTALFNWLFAKAKNGKFFLRIEDTDVSRSEKEYEREIISSLQWMGLDWDGDIMIQSERFDIYKQAAYDLVKKGYAYKIENEDAIRFKMPKNEIFTLKDYIAGDIEIDTSTLDDFVILRSDGSPTYMLASVVDDNAMGITHIIRGNEHLANAFRQQPLIAALGYNVPMYVHLPIIHNQEGKKLSKRDGATGVSEYIENGILSEAFCNYILRLGWGYGDAEIISMHDVIKIFDLSQFGSSPARIDPQKLTWLNGYYMRNTSLQALSEQLKLPDDILPVSDECLKSVIEKCSDLRQIERIVTHIFKSNGVEYIDSFDSMTVEELNFVRNTELEASHDLKDKLAKAIESAGLNKKRIFMFYRLAITGMRVSPGLFEVICSLSKDVRQYRIDQAIAKVESAQ